MHRYTCFPRPSWWILVSGRRSCAQQRERSIGLNACIVTWLQTPPAWWWMLLLLQMSSFAVVCPCRPRIVRCHPCHYHYSDCSTTTTTTAMVTRPVAVVGTTLPERSTRHFRLDKNSTYWLPQNSRHRHPRPTTVAPSCPKSPPLVYSRTSPPRPRRPSGPRRDDSTTVIVAKRVVGRAEMGGSLLFLTCLWHIQSLLHCHCRYYWTLTFQTTRVPALCRSPTSCYYH
jgi:hypothetical protein